MSWKYLRSIVVFGGVVVAAGAAHSGVPRACIHPVSDPVECTRVKSLERYDVLGSARIRELRLRESVYQEKVVPIQDAERNRLLKEIRNALCDAPLEQ